MITIISGGTESLKLIRALRHLLNDDEIAVIANTSDALWIDGTLTSPDIDDLLFLFSGILNTRKWHGIKGDTFSTHTFYNKYFDDDKPEIGDKERAVHTARGRYISQGYTNTQATEMLCKKFNIISRILPATDNQVELSCKVNDETLHPIELKQIYSENELDIIESLNLEYFNEPLISNEAAFVIEESDAVIIGPGCPLTSIMPVIACQGLQKILQDKFTISFAPASPRRDIDYAQSNYDKILNAYGSFSDLIIQNSEEITEIESALKLNTKMSSRHSAESLAWDLMSVIRSHSKKIA